MRGRFERVGDASRDLVETPQAPRGEAAVNGARHRRPGQVPSSSLRGDRDRGKRPRWGPSLPARGQGGRTAQPAQRDPKALIEQILKGIDGDNTMAVADRREAIASTIDEAGTTTDRDRGKDRDDQYVGDRVFTSTTEQKRNTPKKEIEKAFDINMTLPTMFMFRPAAVSAGGRSVFARQVSEGD